MKSNHPLLVVSLHERWPEYVVLAKRLARVNSPLFMASFDNIDLESKSVKGIHVHPNGTVTKASFKLPKMVWFKQTSMGVRDTVSSVQALEGAGCRNVNSSSAIRLAVDKIRCARMLSPICEQGNPTLSAGENAVAKLMSPGVRWTKPVNASLGKDVMRIVGHGNTALVSRRSAGIPCHKLLDANGLSEALAKTYNREDFMIQDDLGNMNVGGSNFEIRFIMRRCQGGWRPSCRIARAGLLLSNPNPISSGLVACSALQAIKMAVDGDAEHTLSAFHDKALEACLVFQSSLDDPEDVGELGIDMTMSKNGPTVIEINSVPDLTFVDKVAACKNSVLALMKASGNDVGFEPLPDSESQDSRGDVADVIHDKLSNSAYKTMVARELAHEEIWLHAGNVSLEEDGELKTYTFDEAIKALRHEVECAAAWARQCDNDEKKLPMALDCVDNAMHRLLLLKEMYYLKSGKRHVSAMSKFADAGSHMSNIVVPTEKVIQQVDDMEDWLTKLKEQLPRRPKESNTPNGKYIGFEWQIINWDTPQEWDEFMNDSNYKIRNDLKR